MAIPLQDKGNRFVVVDKETDQSKTQEQTDWSSFKTLDHDPTSNYIKIMSEWAKKWFRKCEIRKQWTNYIINEDAQPGKKSTLYKTHEKDNLVRLFNAGCNTAIENLSRFIESISGPLIEKMRYMIRNTSHLLGTSDAINKKRDT